MKVSLLGHSYVRDLSELNVRVFELSPSLQLEVSYFSFPGARFSSFLNNLSCLDELIDGRPDIVVVILGGNDFQNNTLISDVTKQCSCFYKYLREKLPQTRLIATQVELRFYKPNNIYNCPEAATYKKVIGYFNKYLQKAKPADSLICILGPNRMSKESLYRSDGIHLNREGLNKLMQIIQSALYNFLTY